MQSLWREHFDAPNGCSLSVFVENTVDDMGSDGPLWSVPAGGGRGGSVAGRRCS